jgi:hypothetical protein
LSASQQNQHSAFAHSDKDLIRIHAVRLPTLLQVEKLIANSMDPDQTHAGWSGSMLVTNALCWFCRDTAQLYIIEIVLGGFRASTLLMLPGWI